MKTQTPATCVQFRNDVTEYLEDALGRQDRESFELHRDWCGSCREFLSEMVDCIEDLGRLCVNDLTPVRESELVALLHRDHQTDEESRRATGASPEELLQELMDHSPEQRVILVENSERFKSVELCQLALDRGFELGAQDPPEADGLISLAVAIADLLVADDHSEGVVRDLGAKSYAYLGNIRRIRSDLSGSASAFEIARRKWAEGTGSLTDEAVICDLEAALLSEKRQFGEALALLDRAIERFALEGSTHLEGRTWFSKADVLDSKGESGKAIEALEKGIALVDPEVEPRLALLAKHNLLVYLREEGRLEEIASLYPETREIHTRLGNAVDLTRFKWLEGQIAVDSDRLIDAEKAFLEVKRFFVDKGMAHDVALVSLDLALVYLRQGRFGELKALASEMLTIFSSLKIHQETLAALAFCRKALEVENMTVAFVNELGSRLESARERARFGVGLSVAE